MIIKQIVIITKFHALALISCLDSQESLIMLLIDQAGRAGQGD